VEARGLSPMTNAPDSPRALAPESSTERPQLVAPPSVPDLRAQYGLRSAPPELAEHLALVTRWFYSKPREGEILFRAGEWPYRRILRACGRLLAPPTSPAAPAEPPKA